MLHLPPREKRGRQPTHTPLQHHRRKYGYAGELPGVSPPSPTYYSLGGEDPAGCLSPQHKYGHAGWHAACWEGIEPRFPTERGGSYCILPSRLALRRLGYCLSCASYSMSCQSYSFSEQEATRETTKRQQRVKGGRTREAEGSKRDGGGLCYSLSCASNGMRCQRY